ncbi:MAG TPA: dTDP-4-dehydrorhamnose reductase [Solirubrobacteraceae bacterium]|nr:dTDP-4-dehydrorhamnose reductase [Solirubrobacteraceae bacterium]
MRILITGAAGMLGNDVTRMADTAGHEPIALARSALDITDPAAVVAAVRSAAPDAVVNCAAWTDVDGAEEAFEDALAINGAGAGHVAAAAAAAGAWTIHVSSDYVFDGEKSEPYMESDPVAPVSAYGRSKLAGEQEVAVAAPDRHTIVRSSWLFGVHGRCFPKTILRLAEEREELAVVSDQIGCPTFTGHLAGALVALAENPLPGVLHVAGAGACSWFEFAAAIVAAAGSRCQVRPISTEQYPTPARRPAYSVLESERGAPQLAEWQQALREFLSELSGVAA